MPKIAYIEKRFTGDNAAIVTKANEIIGDYMRDGYTLTLRQLYYQFVARDLVENTVQSYKRLGSIINDARLAGLVDWLAIEDRTRSLSALSHWSDPADIMRSAAASFRVDKWATQPCRVEVWVEKEALAGVFERVCQENDVPFLSCRGYTSQSEMWGASQRLKCFAQARQKVVILHFGDHDPSGIDMSRDIQDRLKLFGVHLSFKRLALNMPQVEEYSPPPNPAKTTDSRYEGYIAEYGPESWELDALEPSVLAGLVQAALDKLRDADAWAAEVEREAALKADIEAASGRWGEVVEFLHEDNEQ